MKNEIDSKPNRLGPADAADILCLISNGYDSHVLAGSVYSSDKVLGYLQDVLCDKDNIFYGYFFGADLACFIHIKMLAQWVHLNHIVTVERYKGLGFASAMMNFIMEIANRENKGISLDVDSENFVVKSWYASLGFIEVNNEKKQLLAGKGQRCDLLKWILLDEKSSWSSYGVGFGRLQIEGVDLQIPVGVVSPATFNIDSSLLVEGVADYVLTQNKGCSIVAHGLHSLKNSEFFEKEWTTFRMEKLSSHYFFSSKF
jgi:ribosomal protein S18 acetylase RimI-like enzyme